jgi:radical SAM protein with 4Fe4S-binding SPASM domain
MKNEMLNGRYVFNPCYILRNDINRVVLTDSGKSRYDKIGNNNFAEFIHPIHAMFLSFFNGNKTLCENLKEISCFFSIEENRAYELAKQFIENKDSIVVEFDGNFYYYPEKVLIEDKNGYQRNYCVEDFNITEKLDFENQRYNIPVECTLVLNTTCVTNCIYCYADRHNSMKNQISFGKIQEIIAETKRLKFKNVDITGGELFLYEHWYELLELLYKNDYEPYLTTKVPIGEKEVSLLKKLNVEAIQISLDSIFAEDLEINLQVGEQYHQKILNTIDILNKNEMRIKIKSVLTNQIFNIDKISKFIDHFKQFKNVCLVELTAPGPSNYKSNEEFLKYRLSLTQIQQIKDLIETKSKEVHFELNADTNTYTKEMFCNSFENKKMEFYKRAHCTGNERSFYILPNGDISICEELYFNENLKLGNILNNSIMEMWNSEQAVNLFYISQSKFPKESYCSKCAEFKECRHKRGICWVDVIAAYGNNKWLYPSPECQYAPQIKNKIYCE